MTLSPLKQAAFPCAYHTPNNWTKYKSVASIDAGHKSERQAKKYLLLILIWKKAGHRVEGKRRPKKKAKAKRHGASPDKPHPLFSKKPPPKKHRHPQKPQKIKLEVRWGVHKHVEMQLGYVPCESYFSLVNLYFCQITFTTPCCVVLFFVVYSHRQVELSTVFKGYTRNWFSRNGLNFYSGFFIYIVSSTHFLMRLIISLLSKKPEGAGFLSLYT